MADFSYYGNTVHYSLCICTTGSNICQEGLYMFLSNMSLEKCELLFDIHILAMEIYTICLRGKDNRVVHCSI